MTNADKYLKDGVDVEELRKEFEDWYAITRRANTPANYLVEFLNEEVKPTLTEDEKVILRNSLVCPFDDIFQTIGRNSRKKIYLTGKYCSTNYILKEEYQGFFQFIQPRRRI